MTMVQNQLPILMLAERSSFEQVGLFNISFRLLIPLQLLVNTGLSVLYPYLSQLKIQNAAKYMRATENALKMIVVVGSSFALLISLFRIEVVKILFGAKYVGASDAVALQCWYTVFYAVLCLIGTSLAATDKQHWLAALTTFYTIVALPIIWLGTAHGATGLAAGMAIGGFINLTYHWYYFRKSLPGKLQSRSIVHLFIILGGAVLGSWIFPEDNSIALKAIIASAVIVFGGIALLKTWEQLRHAP
jgi:O-antigen/teichoic acid export membrane protein